MLHSTSNKKCKPPPQAAPLKRATNFPMDKYVDCTYVNRKLFQMAFRRLDFKKLDIYFAFYREASHKVRSGTAISITNNWEFFCP